MFHCIAGLIFCLAMSRILNLYWSFVTTIFWSAMLGVQLKTFSRVYPSHAETIFFYRCVGRMHTTKHCVITWMCRARKKDWQAWSNHSLLLRNISGDHLKHHNLFWKFCSTFLNHTLLLNYKCCSGGSPCFFCAEEGHSSCTATLEDGESQKRQSHSSSTSVCKTGRLYDMGNRREAHSGKRRFQCHLCPQSFKSRGNLNQHMRVHTGERPHQCPSCDKSFSTKYILSQHLRIHTGERPYQCSFCPQRFAWHSYLSEHQRVHTGEKPFKCDFCPASFRWNPSLKKHLRTHTRERP